MTAARNGALERLLTIVIAISLSGCATTKQDWREADRVGKVQAYESFLKKHPAAEEADEVRRLLPELRESEDWHKAEYSNTIPGYEEFVGKHPQSPKRSWPIRHWNRCALNKRAQATRLLPMKHI